jgi:pyruvate-formate lyase-activating enzyme
MFLGEDLVYLLPTLSEANLMREPDWKIFKQIKQKAIEEYCEQALKEFSEIINDDKEHVHNRFLLIRRLAQNREKEMSLIFDYDSRSKAPIQLMLIRKEGLADNHLLNKLSDDFLQETDPKSLK